MPRPSGYRRRNTQTAARRATSSGQQNSTALKKAGEDDYTSQSADLLTEFRQNALNGETLGEYIRRRNNGANRTAELQREYIEQNTPFLSVGLAQPRLSMTPLPEVDKNSAPPIGSPNASRWFTAQEEKTGALRKDFYDRYKQVETPSYADAKAQASAAEARASEDINDLALQQELQRGYELTGITGGGYEQQREKAEEARGRAAVSDAELDTAESLTRAAWFNDRGAYYDSVKNRPDYAQKAAQKDNPLPSGYFWLLPEEREMYNYLNNNPANGAADAKEYLKYLDYGRDYANMQTMEMENREFVAGGENGVIAATLARAISPFANVIGSADFATQRARERLTGRPVNYNSGAQMMGEATDIWDEENARGLNSLGTLPEDIPVIGGKGLGDLYQVGMSMLDSYVNAGITGGLLEAFPNATEGQVKALEVLGTSVMGAGATRKGIAEAIENGASENDAYRYGLLQGINETLFEHVSMDKFLSDEAPETIAQAIIDVFEQGGVEGSEEVFTSIANAAADEWVNGGESEFNRDVRNYMENDGLTEEEARKRAGLNFSERLVQDFLGGFISGFGMSGGRAVIDVAETSAFGKDMKNGKTEMGAEQAVMIGQQLPATFRTANGTEVNLNANRLANEIAAKGIDNVSNMKLGRLQQYILDDMQHMGMTEDQYYGMLDEANLQTDVNTLLRQAAEDMYVYDEDVSAEEVRDNEVKRILSYDNRTDEQKENAFKRIVNNGDDYVNNEQLQVRVGKSGRHFITDIDTDKETVKLDNGKTVSIDSVEADENVARLLATAEKLPTYAARELLSNYKGGDSFDYDLDFRKMFSYGRQGVPLESVVNDQSTLSEYAKTRAYAAGSNALYESQQNMQARSRGGLIREHRAVSREQDMKLNALDTMFRVLGQTARTMDTISYTDKEGKLHTSAANAYYDRTNDEFVFALDSVNDALLHYAMHELTHGIRYKASEDYFAIRNAVVAYLETNGQSITDLIEEQRALDPGHKPGYYEEEVVANTVASILGDEKTLSEFADRFVVDEDTRSAFRRLIDAIIDFIKDIHAKMMGLRGWEQIASITPEQLVDIRDKFFKGLETLRDGGSARIGTESEENWSADDLYDYGTEPVLTREIIDAMETISDAGLGVDLKTNTVFSKKYTTGEAIVPKANRKDLVSAITRMTGRSEQDVEGYLEAEQVASLMVDGTPLDFTGNDKEVAIKENSDYPQGTVDLVNICPKRVGVTQITNRLQESLPNDLFTADDYADIRLILMEDGRVVACGLCFVEDRRRLLGEITEMFIKDWNDAVKEGRNLTRLNSKGEVKDVSIAKDLAKRYGVKPGLVTVTQKNLQQATFMSSDNWHKLQGSDPYLAAAFEAYNNARGQSAGRLLSDRAEYKREILSWSDKRVADTNAVGGLRIFSFSDFEVIHLLDIIQIIEDCAARGVMIQGYTKQPAFAALVAKTGIKLNRSFIPYGATGLRTVNGKRVLALDTREGIDTSSEFWEKETDNPNVGNNITGINDEQIHVAMLDNFIHYIIPYHTNKGNDAQDKIGTKHWDNYKAYQTDKVGTAEDITEVAKAMRAYKLLGMSDTKAYVKAVKDIAKATKRKPEKVFTALKETENINIYTEVLNDPSIKTERQFTERFLEVCKQKNIMPRFAQFLEVNEKGEFVYTPGYSKFLVDFKTFDYETGEYLPQQKVVPDIDAGLVRKLIEQELAKDERERNGTDYPEDLYNKIRNYIKVKHGWRGNQRDYQRYANIIKKQAAKTNSDENGTGEFAISPSARSYSLKPVAPIVARSNGWRPATEEFNTEAKIRQKYPDLFGATEEEAKAAQNDKKGQPTQTTSTDATYREIFRRLRAKGFSGSILDASSGMGRGTRIGRSEYGYDVDDIEPYPGKEYEKVLRYNDYSQHFKSYDYIISNAVLNVMAQDQRDALIVKMGEMLNPGGTMFINVRSAKDVDKIKSRQPIDPSNHEWYIAQNKAYQKGFVNEKGKPNELQAYVEDALGSDYIVEPAKDVGDAAVFVHRKANSKLDPRYTPAETKAYNEEKRPTLKTLKGSAINRSKYGVGKMVGSQLYFHKNYVWALVSRGAIPRGLFEKAAKLLPKGFEYNALMFDRSKPDVLRFDSAPGFDTEREPVVGDYITVNTKTGEVTHGHSDQIWHHKWMWVGENYTGFNTKNDPNGVDTAYNWSKQWLEKITKPSGYKGKWDAALREAGLPIDEVKEKAPAKQQPKEVRTSLKASDAHALQDALNGGDVETAERIFDEWQTSGGVRYSFRGENSYLTKADMNNLAVAKEMEANDEQNETIRLATGWFKSYDGKWRNEINDSKMKFRNIPALNDVALRKTGDVQRLVLAEMEADLESVMKKIDDLAHRNVLSNAPEYRELVKQQRKLEKEIREQGFFVRRAERNNYWLDDILEHPKLFKAYPKLKRMEVHFFAPGNNEYGLDDSTNGGTDGKNALYINVDRSQSDMARTIMHEVQHVIQETEGFSSGSNDEFWARWLRANQAPFSLTQKYTRAYASFLDALNELESVRYDEDSYKNPVDAASLYVYHEQLLRDHRAQKFAAGVRYDNQKIRDIKAEAEEAGYYDELMAFVRANKRFEAARTNLGVGDAYNLYFRTAGEVEARDVAYRVGLTAAQRKKSTPDINRTDVVFAEDPSKRLGSVQKRLSMKAPIERTKDLIAEHNLSVEYLLAAIREGGFPSPSTAVHDVNVPHTSFGECSVIFKASAVDPQANPDNRVYGGDAWTPVRGVVQVSAKVDEDVRTTYNDTLREFAEGYKKKYGVSIPVRYFPDLGDIDEDAFMSADDLGVQLAYLNSKGETIAPVMVDDSDYRTYGYYGKDFIKAILDRFSESELVDNYWAYAGSRKNLQETHSEYLNELAEKTGKGVDQIMIRDALRKALQRVGSLDVIDKDAMRSEVWNKTSFANIEAWVREKLDGVYAGKVIANDWGNDLPYTLENIVDAMYEDGERGVNAPYSVDGLRSILAPSYRSVAEIHADEGKLYKASNFAQRVSDIEDDIYDIAQDVEADIDDFWEMLLDTARMVSAYMDNGDPWDIVDIMDNFENGYDIELTTHTASRIEDVFVEIQALPTLFFEAKRRGVVGLDEIAAVLIPDYAGESVFEEVRNAGINAIPYSDYNERQQGVQSVDARFSLKNDQYMRIAERIKAARDAGKEASKSDLDTAALMVADAALDHDYTVAAAHGTMRGGHTVFKKEYARAEGNSGAGFYLSSDMNDVGRNYFSDTGADNESKIERYADVIYNAGEWVDPETGDVFDVDDYDQAQEYARREMTGKPTVYRAFLNLGKTYVRNYAKSTNLIDDLMSGFNYSYFDRDDYDTEDEYDDAINEAKAAYLRLEIENRLSDAIDATENEFGFIGDPYGVLDDVVDDILTVALDYDALTWKDVEDALDDHMGYFDVVEHVTGDTAIGTVEVTRAFIEALGYNSVTDKEADTKFRGMWLAPGTIHYIVFSPDQIKLSDPVTYDDDGEIIPLDERFDKTHPNRKDDVRWSLRNAKFNEAYRNNDEALGAQMVRDAAIEAGFTTPLLYHGTNEFGFTEFDVELSSGAIFATSSRGLAETYSGETQRSRLTDVNDIDVRKLTGKKLLTTARKYVPKYRNYKYMTRDDVTRKFDACKKWCADAAQAARSFVQKNRSLVKGEPRKRLLSLADKLEICSRAGEDGGDSTVENAQISANSILGGISWQPEFKDDGYEPLRSALRDGDSVMTSYRNMRSVLNGFDEWFYHSSNIYDRTDVEYGGERLQYEIQYDLRKALNAGIYELYGNPGKQLVIDAKGSSWSAIYVPDELQLSGVANTREIADAAKKHGYDSVLIRNVVDYGGSGYDEPGDVYIFFDANRLKSADPFTFDDDGRLIPISERFNKKRGDIRWSLKSMAQLSREHAEAEKRGDKEAGQRLVDEAARRAGYRTEYMYRGDEEPYNVLLRADELDWEYAEPGNLGYGIYFTPNERYAQRFGETRKFYLKYNNLADVTNDENVKSILNDIENELVWGRDDAYYDTGEIFDELISRLDADAVGGTNVGGFAFGASEVAVRESWQAKLADPFTYDDDGKLIPLTERFNVNSDDVRRSTKPLSNREILADALLTAAETQEEREMLENYKSLAGNMNAMQERLDGVNARIYEIMQKSGEAAKTGEMQRLQQTSKELSAQLQRYDKKLLSLEATEPLAKVVEREKNKAFSRGKRQGAARVRAEKNARIDEIRKQESQYRQERVAKVRAGYDNRIARDKYRNRIQRNVNDIYTWLAKPTDAKHVPEEIRGAVTDFIKSIDLSKKSEKGRVWRAKMNAIVNQLQNPSIAKEYEAFAADIDPELALRMRKFATNNSRDIDLSVMEMTVEELRDLSEIVAALKHLITEANYMHGLAQRQFVSEVAERTVQDFDRIGKFNRTKKGEALAKIVDYNQMDAYSFFHSLGDAGMVIYDDLRGGLDKFITLSDEAKIFTEKTAGIIGNEEISGKKAKKHTVNIGGNTVTMTVGQIMSLYELNQRDDARRHIYTGGIFLRTDTGDAYRITEAEVKEITSLLTKEEIRYADALQEFMSTRVTAWGNEASMQMYGYRKFTDPHYFPITVVSGTTNTMDNIGESTGMNQLLYRLKNLGFTKTTDENAKNPLVVDDINTVFGKHTTDMAEYAAFLAPLSDAMKWFNANVGDDGRKVSFYMKQAFQRKGSDGKYHDPASQWFTNFIAELNGGAARNNTVAGLQRIIGNAKAAAVGLNLSVVAQQPMAYARAFAEVDAKYMIAALTRPPQMKQAWKYCPIAKWKHWGMFESMVSKNVEQILSGKPSPYEQLRDKQMWLAGAADDVTWGYIWNACELEQRAENPGHPAAWYKSDEFYEIVGKRMSRVIDSTQVVDSIFHRPLALKHKALQTMTAFMAEPMKSYNLLQRSVTDVARGEKGAKVRLARALTGWAIAQVLAAAAQSLVGAMRKDDKDKTYWQKWWQAMMGEDSFFTGNLFDNINPLSLHWVTKYLWGAAEQIFTKNTYSNSSIDQQLATKIRRAIQTAQKAADPGKRSELTAKEIVQRTADVVSTATGVGAYNAIRDVWALVEMVTGRAETPFFDRVESEIAEGSTEAIDALIAEKAAAKQAEKPGLSDKKAEDAARSDVRSKFTTEYKPAYLEAYYTDDRKEMKRITDMLIKTGLYGTREDAMKDFVKWVTDDLKKQLEASDDKAVRDRVRQQLYKTGKYKSMREVDEQIREWVG